MKLSKLVEVVRKWNEDWFRGLAEKHSVVFENADPAKDNSARSCVLRRDGDCWDGLLPRSFEVTDIQHPIDGRSIATGAVIDAESDVGDDDLPVIIAVGINYWQFGNTSGSWPIADWRRTLMRPRLNDALAYLSVKAGSRDFSSGYHLVAVNFFPWVTRVPWADIDINQLGEAMAVHCLGLPDAGERISQLAQILKEEGTAPSFCFHGVNNAVPALALEVVRILKSTGSAENVFFTDNLARMSPAKNKIVLCPVQNGRATATKEVADN